MSRTKRRQEKYRIEQYVAEEESAKCGREPYITPLLRHLTTEQRLKYHRARISRDHHSGVFGVPRWYRHQYGCSVVRRKEKKELLRCLRQDCWEDHLPDSRIRDSKFYWWY